MADKNDEAVANQPVQEPEKVEPTEPAKADKNVEAKTEPKAETKPKTTRKNLRKELAKQQGTSATGYTAYIRARIKAGK